MKKAWAPPTARVAELMRAAAACGLRDASEMSALDPEAIGSLAPAILADPALTAALQSTTRDNVMHWLSRVAVDPASPVEPARSPNGLEFARDLVRRGYDTAAIATYLSGQNVAWRSWMKACFEVTEDQVELQDLLSYSSRSIFTYVEATIADLSTVMRAQRSILTHGTNADRLELVSLLLEGAKVPLDATSGRLGHDLRRNQTALILWQDPGLADFEDLERAARAAAKSVGLVRPLVVFASAGSVWVWCAGADFPDVGLLADSLGSFPHVRMAIGATAPGLAGFRQSHADALTTQRLMVKAREDVRTATYEAVRVASFVTSDTDRADEFVARTLGSLATADAMLQDTLRIYLREDASAARTARVLHTHRNTIQNRVARAEAMLPVGLDGQGLAVALALEIVRWTGTRAPVAGGAESRGFPAPQPGTDSRGRPRAS